MADQESQPAAPAVMDYDHNLNYCGNRTTQRVRLLLGMNDYRHTIEVETRGNLIGFERIEQAIENAYEALPGAGSDHSCAEVTLYRGEDELLVEDWDGEGEDWLKELVLSAEILSIEPYKESAIRQIGLKSHGNDWF